VKIREMIGKKVHTIVGLCEQTMGDDDLWPVVLAAQSFLMAGQPHDILIGVWHDEEGTNVTFRSQDGREWDSYWPLYLQRGEDDEDNIDSAPPESKCQSKNHTEHYGNLWECKMCGKMVCCNEGTTDNPDICDDCYDSLV